MKVVSRRPLLVILAVLMLLIGLLELQFLALLPADASASSSASQYKEITVSIDSQTSVVNPPLSDEMQQSINQSLPINQSKDPRYARDQAFIEAFTAYSPWAIGDVIDRCPEFSQSIRQPVHTVHKLNVLIFHHSLAATSEKAAQGASMGELTWWKEILFGLCLIDLQRTFVTDESIILSMIEQESNSTKLFDILLTDVYSLISLKEKQSFKGWLSSYSNKCRLRIIDDWGTPVNQNRAGLHLQQYLVPWSCAPNADVDIEAINSDPPLSINGNYFLGHFVLPSVPEKPIPKKRQGLLWGKEASYFRTYPIMKMLENLANDVPLIMTAQDRADQFLHHSNITNIGIVDQPTRERLLHESLFLLGVGDPIVGLTPFEAMSHAVIYLNPVYSQFRKFWMNPSCLYHNQHPATMRLNEPYVYHYKQEVGTKLEEMIGNVRQIVKKILANYDANNHIQPFIDPFLTLDQFVKRLSGNLHAQHICASDQVISFAAAG